LQVLLFAFSIWLPQIFPCPSSSLSPGLHPRSPDLESLLWPSSTNGNVSPPFPFSFLSVALFPLNSVYFFLYQFIVWFLPLECKLHKAKDLVLFPCVYPASKSTCIASAQKCLVKECA
jgi:hypothetical protein